MFWLSLCYSVLQSYRFLPFENTYCVIAAWMCLSVLWERCTQSSWLWGFPCMTTSSRSLPFLPAFSCLFARPAAVVLLFCTVSNDWSVQHWCRCCTLAVKFYVPLLLESIYPAFKQLIFEGRRRRGGIQFLCQRELLPRELVTTLSRLPRCKVTSKTAWGQEKGQHCSGKCCRNNFYKGIQSCREESLALVKLNQ